MQLTKTPRFAYLHGLGSGPASYKGTLLRERLAGTATLELPDLNRPSLEELSPIAGLDHLDGLTRGATWSFIGSSYGGWLAALFAARHPERVERLLLLCPGFDLGTRWPELLGAGAMSAWESTGALPLDQGGTIPWSFRQECLTLDPRPTVSQPTWIVHGRADEVVPFASSVAYAEAHPNVTLVPVDDDHGLTASVDTIEALVRAHLIPSPR